MIIAVALIFAIPFTALARMSSLDDADLDEVTGQVGLSIDLTFHVNDSYIAWTDDDGWGTTKDNLNHQGALTMCGFKIDEDGDGGDLSLTGLTYDVGATSAGASYLAIGLPDMYGWIRCSSFKIGSNPNIGGGLGEVVIGNLNTDNSSIKLTPY